MKTRLLQKIAFFQQAIDEDPDFSDAYNATGQRTGQEGDADAAIERSIERRSGSIHPTPRRFAIAPSPTETRGCPSCAAADFEQAGKLNPTAQTFFDLGRAYEDLEKRDLAIKAYDEAIRLDARHPLCSQQSLLLEGNPRGPLGDRGLRQGPLLLLSPNFETYDSRGFAYLKLNELDKAIADYDTALNRHMLQPGPRGVVAKSGRGVAKRRKGDLAGSGCR